MDQERDQRDDAAVFNLPPLPDVLFAPNRACRDFDWAVLIPLDQQRYRIHEFRNAAQLLCADCPIRISCRDHGFTADEFGVWGGWFLNPQTGACVDLIGDDYVGLDAIA